MNGCSEDCEASLPENLFKIICLSINFTSSYASLRHPGVYENHMTLSACCYQGKRRSKQSYPSFSSQANTCPYSLSSRRDSYGSRDGDVFLGVRESPEPKKNNPRKWSRNSDFLLIPSMEGLANHRPRGNVIKTLVPWLDSCCTVRH